MQKIKVGISQGDINGVGYEVILKTFASEEMLSLCTPVIFGSPKVAVYYRKSVENAPNFNVVDRPEKARDGQLNIVDCLGDTEVKIEPGTPTPEAGSAAFKALEAAVSALDNQLIDVLVTAPINKNTIQNDKFHFPGHTEYIEQKAGGGQRALMILMNESLRVALVTTHVPVSKIAQKITKQNIEAKLNILDDTLKRDFAIDNPRIAVLSLNPHCGDNGVIGNWGHMPGADDPGTTYTGEIYLVNENSGYYFTIRYRIDFVSEIVEPVIAGQQEVTVKVSDDGELTALDLTPVLEALGIEETELPSDAQWLVSSFATIYDQTNYTDDGYFFGADGKTCDIQTDEGANAALFLLTYDAQEGGFYAEAQQELPEGATYQTKLVLNYNEKYYVFNITVEPATAEVVDAIQTVKMEHAQQSQLFNLNGQVVNENYRGIVVKNGKKRLKM